MKPKTVAEALNASQAITGAIRRATLGLEVIRSSDKQAMTLAACDLAMEHQTSIALLVGHNLPGSAFALLRPLYEARNRALWLHECASEEKATGILLGAASFPDWRTMIGAIEQAFVNTKAAGRFSQSKLYRDQMHGFVHAGVEQLDFRFGSLGQIGPNYPTEAVITLLKDSSHFAVTATLVMLREFERGDLGSVLAATYVARFVDDQSGEPRTSSVDC